MRLSQHVRSKCIRRSNGNMKSEVRRHCALNQVTPRILTRLFQSSDFAVIIFFLSDSKMMIGQPFSFFIQLSFSRVTAASLCFPQLARFRSCRARSSVKATKKLQILRRATFLNLKCTTGCFELDFSILAERSP